MALSRGTHELGPAAGRLLVRTGRSGLGRKAGHDLTLEVTRWAASVHVAEPDGSSVTAEIEASSLEVREGTGGVKPLTGSDRAEIGRVVRGKILHTEAHPVIAFRSTGASGTPEAFTVEGELTIMGVTRPLTLRGQVSGDRLTGGATVVQSRWGIKPYSALFGQLRLADEVAIEFDLTVDG